VLRAKTILMAEEKHMNKKIGKRFPLQKTLMVAQDTSILEMLMIFQEKKQTLAFITNLNKKEKILNDQHEMMFFKVYFYSYSNSAKT